jgi:hypothetical protein
VVIICSLSLGKDRCAIRAHGPIHDAARSTQTSWAVPIISAHPARKACDSRRAASPDGLHACDNAQVPSERTVRQVRADSRYQRPHATGDQMGFKAQVHRCRSGPGATREARNAGRQAEDLHRDAIHLGYPDRYGPD